ncbi:MAG: SAM-dependent methyltransferase [Prevotella sp.]|nr:SAM-dependent methyltransferase [Prevotella sp.]
MTNEVTKIFIRDHREDDVRRLALEGSRNSAVDLPFALDQIQGWQTARRKLPFWAAHDDVVYPPHLNMEQCSSEQTARYKQQVVCRFLADFSGPSVLVDLTGGYGVDFFYLSEPFTRAVYVERHAALSELVGHNLGVLGRSQAEVHCADGVEFLDSLPTGSDRSAATVIFLDPARRGSHGQKVFGLQDCEPDVTQLRDRLLDRCDVLMLKLSPMLDWHEALRQLCPSGRGCEVHIVSAGGECKELLLVMTHDDTPLRVYCVNDDELFDYMPQSSDAAPTASSATVSAPSLAGWLLVPNASIMKAGCFRELAAAYGLHVVDRNSHLFVADGPVAGFPGRQFCIRAVSSMNKREVREALRGITQANIATRNFPLSVAELRKRLKLHDGGSLYLFATTWQKQHVLLFCEAPTK